MISRNKKGFTIIEVVLVLAIAGLIFLMVFIALPALQRSQRNTQRRSDMSRIMAAVEDYQTNNNNKNPFQERDFENFVKRYIDENCNASGSFTKGSSTYLAFTGCGDQFTDPDGSIYGLFYRDIDGAFAHDEGDGLWSVDMGAPWGHSSDGIDFNHWIYGVPGASCGSKEGTLTKGKGKNMVAILYTLEGGSVVCYDNN